jgi:hypothetical protein
VAGLPVRHFSHRPRPPAGLIRCHAPNRGKPGGVSRLARFQPARSAAAS